MTSLATLKKKIRNAKTRKERGKALLAWDKAKGRKYVNLRNINFGPLIFGHVCPTCGQEIKEE